MAHKKLFISSFPYSLTLVFKKLKGSEHKMFKNCRIKRRTKNWPRTSRTQERLNHCILLAIYKEMTDKLSLIDVAANEFCFGSDERSSVLSHFCQNNLRFKVCTF